MSANSNVERYQIFFRTSRGGRGLEYETAKAEFLSVFGDERVDIVWEIPGRMRMDIHTHGLTAGEISRRAEALGYTQGIISVHEEPYMGEALHSRLTGRWAVGWLRRGDSKLLLTEVYRQNEGAISSEAPHERVFLVDTGGQIRAIKGHRRRRGLSPADAKFMVNIAKLRGDELILDPFAGIGGIVMECRKRNLNIIAADVDDVLRPGLAEVSDNQYAIADARRLPFRDGSFGAIITEPPFNTRYRQAVIDSMSELRRVLKKGGKIVLLIAHDMHQDIMNFMLGSGFQLNGDYKLRRHGKLTSHVLLAIDRLCYSSLIIPSLIV